MSRMSELNALRIEHGYTLTDLAKPKAIISHKGGGEGSVGYTPIAMCDNLDEAEDLIEVYEQLDEDGVMAGDYHIDWPVVLAVKITASVHRAAKEEAFDAKMRALHMKSARLNLLATSEAYFGSPL